MNLHGLFQISRIIYGVVYLNFENGMWKSQSMQIFHEIIFETKSESAQESDFVTPPMRKLQPIRIEKKREVM